MATIAALRKQAKDAGIPVAEIRKVANDAGELQGLIDNYGLNGDSKPAKKKGVVKKAVSAAKKKATKATAKKSGRKSAPAAKKSTTGKAKRPTTAKRASTKRTSTTTDVNSGRFTLNGVDYGQDEGWNAREGSPPSRIIKSLKKFRGNRSKVFDALKGDVWDFVGKVKRNGEKRNKAEALEMLRYRISRTAWEFAVRTGQHEASGNRVEYGTGGTGEGVWKPASARKRAAAKRSTAKRTTTKKRKATPKRATAQKRSQKRTAAPKRKAAKRRTAKR